MRLSEVTVTDLANYLKEESANSEITAFLAAAISYIKSYTGLDFSSETEVVGIGDGQKTDYRVQQYPVIECKVFVDGIESSAIVNERTGEIRFLTAPVGTITATYQWGLDVYEDLSIAAYVLVQDMYDNRVMYVDKSNVNKVVETILGMHSRNLI